MSRIRSLILVALSVQLALGYAISSEWQHPRSPDSSKNVIIEMFEWTWDSIATECTQFIGPAGYGYVQGISSSISNKMTMS